MNQAMCYLIECALGKVSHTTTIPFLHREWPLRRAWRLRSTWKWQNSTLTGSKEKREAPTQPCHKGQLALPPPQPQVLHVARCEVAKIHRILPSQPSRSIQFYTPIIQISVCTPALKWTTSSQSGGIGLSTGIGGRTSQSSLPFAFLLKQDWEKLYNKQHWHDLRFFNEL